MIAKAALKPGQTMTVAEKLPYLLELREMMDEGYQSSTKIASRFGISQVTAIQWRKEALVMIAKDDNGWTRDALRNIQIGRLQHKIERLERDLRVTDDVQDSLKVHDRIIKYYDALARITGLNSETVDINVKSKPLTINMPTEAITEATIVDSKVSEDLPDTN